MQSVQEKTSHRQITAAAEILRRGGLVAFPTETVYGLGADAENEDAVRRVFAAKGRPADHPVIVHLADAESLDQWAVDVPEDAWRLAEQFWPGPLTMILQRGGRVPAIVTGGLTTVGLRVPSHPTALALLRAFGGGIAAPSANRFGRVSPTTAAHVRDELGDAVNMVLDGGACDVGLESTIVDLSSGAPAILRPGAITQEDLQRVLDRPVSYGGADAPRCSGSLESHYAPRATVELLDSQQLAARALQLSQQNLKVAVLAEHAPHGLPSDIEYIRLPSDAETCARDLYAALREVDRRACDVALVTLPEETGLGVAIADRLRKAGGPRDRNPEKP
jgi:L-threonylcarbamoyladenylate synthase